MAAHDVPLGLDQRDTRQFLTGFTATKVCSSVTNNHSRSVAEDLPHFIADLWCDNIVMSI